MTAQVSRRRGVSSALNDLRPLRVRRFSQIDSGRYGNKSLVGPEQRVPHRLGALRSGRAALAPERGSPFGYAGWSSFAEDYLLLFEIHLLRHVACIAPLLGGHIVFRVIAPPCAMTHRARRQLGTRYALDIPKAHFNRLAMLGAQVRPQATIFAHGVPTHDMCVKH